MFSWGHLIFNNIIELIVQTLLNENWTELDDGITVFYRAALQLIWTHFIVDDLYTVIELNWINTKLISSEQWRLFF